MRQVPAKILVEDLKKYLQLAEKEAVVITHDGRPAGVLIGFATDEDWRDYQIEHDPRFLKRVERARASLRRGQGVRIEDSV